jgi:glycine cleavage system H lipoate-binding protein
MKNISLRNHLSIKPGPCLWMQAGIVKRKMCTIDYDCVSCKFDRAMCRVSEENRRLKEAGKAPRGKHGKIMFWKDALNGMHAAKRPCIHSMKGRIDFRICTNEYRCGDCEFDQYFQDQYTVHAVLKPVDVMNVDGINVPQGYYIHQGHTWVKIEESEFVRVGLDDFALRLLGPLDSIAAPLVGKPMKQGQADISLSRGSKTAKVLSPVNGVVTDINPKVKDQRGAANASPYTDGWVVRMHSKNLRQDLKYLMIGDEAESFVKKEMGRLYQVVEETAGPLAADGGHLTDDIYGTMPEIGWERLTKSFLRA